MQKDYYIPCIPWCVSLQCCLKLAPMKQWKRAVNIVLAISLFCGASFNFIVEFSATQCFTRVVPSIPNHGLTEVPRVKTIGKGELEERVRLGLPVLVTDQMNDWPATKLWQDVSYFGERCPHFYLEGYSLKSFTDEIKRIEEYIEEHLTSEEATKTDFGDMYFSHNEELFSACPQLWEDVKNFSLVRSHSSSPASIFGFLSRSLISRFENDFLPAEFVWGDWIQAVMWIGPPSSVTKLHYDDDPLSILYQFKGKKRVRMWSPDQSQQLYPQKTCSGNKEYGTRFSRISNIDNEQLIDTYYPRFKNATALEVILEPGMFLYIPSGWWHQVNVLSTSVSVAARSYGTCEGLSYLPNFIINFLNAQGVLDANGWCIAPSYLQNGVSEDKFNL